MNIDKRALREVAERATQGPWEMEQENIWFTDEDGYTKHLAYVEQGDDVDDKQDHYNTAYIAAANPATMLALLDENIQLQREKDAIEAVALALRDDMRQAREQLEREKPLMVDAMHAAVALNSAGINLNDFDNCVSRLHEWGGLPDYCVALYLDYIHGVVSENKLLDFGYISDNGAFSTRQRIAELERSETQLINERDAAESALADMYQAATGERPEWSNMFGFADAVDVVEERLATLEANQSQTTPTGIQLITEAIGAHGYIVGCLLQGRPDLALEESRKWVSAFGQAAEIVSAQDADDIKVKGE
ncbi:TPA: ead/Ea22-like family protein [Salmonella enterica]|nr:ead/Ea22-like family protein [Salmonella enterica]